MKRLFKIIALILAAFVLWHAVPFAIRVKHAMSAKEIGLTLAERAISKFGLTVYGYIPTLQEGRITKISMSLGNEEKRSVEEGRRLIVELTDTFSQVLEEKFQKHLIAPPLEILQLTLFLGKEEPIEEREGFFFVGNYQGKVRYAMYEKNDPFKRCCKTFLRESFKDSQCLIAKENNER